MALRSPPEPKIAGSPPHYLQHHRFSSANRVQKLRLNSVRASLRFGPLFWPWQKVKIGPMNVSPMGFGTWAWGNQVLWGYEQSMDSDLQSAFNLALKNGITLFDTADSYGTGLTPLLGSLNRIAQTRGKTMSQVAINWCICKGTVPIPGIKTVKQVEENLGSLGWKLNSDEISELENSAQASPKKMIQNIFQTA